MQCHSKLCMDLISQGTTLKRQNETLEQYYSRITHLSIVSKSLVEMPDISKLCQLTILYLYDNHLESVFGLVGLPIERLYLQNNNLQSLDGIDGLEKLRVLNLSGNVISKVSFTQLPSLETLHLDKQRVESLVFDPETPQTYTDQLVHVVSMTKIRNIQCPSSVNDRYLRQKMILSSDSIASINGKPVSETEREFLIRMHAAKRKPKQKPVQLKKETLERPMPHLPPYATQYRDLILQQMHDLGVPPAK
ncbi:hypothetical protein EDD86DRAFT_187013 [Gorgonomyces haynaldii]|nr:hypothetical protein EDD86DRAFT_187013 [Gorgonomyces haynaldii]